MQEVARLRSVLRQLQCHVPSVRTATPIASIEPQGSPQTPGNARPGIIPLAMMHSPDNGTLQAPLKMTPITHTYTEIELNLYKDTGFATPAFMLTVASRKPQCNRVQSDICAVFGLPCWTHACLHVPYING